MRVELNAGESHVTINGQRHHITQSGRNGGMVWCECDDEAYASVEMGSAPVANVPQDAEQDDEPEALTTENIVVPEDIDELPDEVEHHQV